MSLINSIINIWRKTFLSSTDKCCHWWVISRPLDHLFTSFHTYENISSIEMEKDRFGQEPSLSDVMACEQVLQWRIGWRASGRKRIEEREGEETLYSHQVLLCPFSRGQSLLTGACWQASYVQLSSKHFMRGFDRLCNNQVSLSFKVQRTFACPWWKQPLTGDRQGTFPHHRRAIWNSKMTIGRYLTLKTNETNSTLRPVLF